MVKNFKCFWEKIKNNQVINQKKHPRSSYIIYNNTILRIDLDTFNRQYYPEDTKQTGRSR